MPDCRSKRNEKQNLNSHTARENINSMAGRTAAAADNTKQ